MLIKLLMHFVTVTSHKPTSIFPTGEALIFTEALPSCLSAFFPSWQSKNSKGIFEYLAMYVVVPCIPSIPLIFFFFFFPFNNDALFLFFSNYKKAAICACFRSIKCLLTRFFWPECPVYAPNKCLLDIHPADSFSSSSWEESDRLPSF